MTDYLRDADNDRICILAAKPIVQGFRDIIRRTLPRHPPARRVLIISNWICKRSRTRDNAAKSEFISPRICADNCIHNLWSGNKGGTFITLLYKFITSLIINQIRRDRLWNGSVVGTPGRLCCSCHNLLPHPSSKSVHRDLMLD